MFNVSCNIDKSDRTNRIVFGVLLLLGALLGFGRGFMFLIGLVLLVEGIIGWCGIPLAMAKINELLGRKPKDPANPAGPTSSAGTPPTV